MRIQCLFSIVLIALFGEVTPAKAQSLCSYQTYTWNSVQREAVKHQRISKPYEGLQPEETDSYTGCSVCEQDQRTINVSPLKPFKVCRLLAVELEKRLIELIEQGKPIKHIEGYRVGRTRGDVDGDGLRTRFSNHSFGIAIDINPQSNGLYDNCVEFNADCRLIRGGHWSPDLATSIQADSEILHAMESMGLKWGGEILGKQKDFMHFSPTGY